MSPKTSSEETLSDRGIPLAGDLLAYIDALTQKAEGEISFRTGSGRIFTDLLIHWPLLEDWENKAYELCQRITDAVYPLVGDLYAQGVEITATISNKPIEAPSHVDAMMTCVIFDIKTKSERSYFLSPDQPLPTNTMLRAEQGIVVLCRPLNLHYHNVQDDREDKAHPHIGIFELAQRLINELYEQPDFIARKKDILQTLKTKIDELPKNQETAEAAAAAEQTTAPVHPPEKEPVLTIPTINSLAALPKWIQALERLLLTYVIDGSVSADLRYRLRQIVQILIAAYPRALIEEAARYETERRAAKSPHALPKAFPKATPTPDVGKLSSLARVKRTQNHSNPLAPTLTD